MQPHVCGPQALAGSCSADTGDYAQVEYGLAGQCSSHERATEQAWPMSQGCLPLLTDISSLQVVWGHF